MGQGSFSGVETLGTDIAEDVTWYTSETQLLHVHMHEFLGGEGLFAPGAVIVL
jgi:hypothetical protein